jgi:hypothetical protein
MDISMSWQASREHGGLTMLQLMQRKRFLLELGASDNEAEELLLYNSSRFDHSLLSQDVSLPLIDEPFAAVWDAYVREAEENGVYHTLQQKVVQLAFPVQEGISKSDAYRAVTLRGEDVSGFKEATGLALNHPESMKLFLHPTAAGRIPVIVISDRSDFVSLVQAISCRNEPKNVPPSMGACMIQGYNNWDRVHQAKAAWLRLYPEGDWTLEFFDFKEKKELYRDRIIVLSEGPYSGVSSAFVGLDEEEWLKKSLIIRLEHECTHYMTRRLLGSMQNNLFDELLADYRGIVAAFGHYRAALFLTFMGLENYPEYRAGGRFENYRGEPPLSSGALSILKVLVHKAAQNLEEIECSISGTVKNMAGRTLVVLALSRMTLEELASPKVMDVFTGHWQITGVIPIVQEEFFSLESSE